MGSLVVSATGFSLAAVVLRIGDFFDKHVLIVFAMCLATGTAIDFFLRTMRPMLAEPLTFARLSDFGLWFHALRYGIFLPLTLLLYVGIAYPLIPSTFGGGQMQVARIYVKAENRAMFSNMSLNTDEHGSIGLWAVVTELPDAIVITNRKAFATGDWKTIWLRKDCIAALVYPSPTNNTP